MPQKSCVLVVDDDPVILNIVNELVQRAGFDAVLSETSQAAMEEVFQKKFAAVLTDYRLPDSSGLALLKRISLCQPDASRIVMTGMPSIDVVLQAVNEGEIFRFVTKPWVSAEMTATIRSAVHRFELLESNRKLRSETEELNRQLADSNRLLDAKISELEHQKNLLAESRKALQNSFHRSLELCHRILNTFNPLLAAQAKLTTELCSAMLETAEFSPEEKYALRLAAPLYDLGLTGVSVLNLALLQREETQVDEESKQTLRNHTIYGQTLATFIAPDKLLGDTIRSHHERIDGNGYPDALAGENIPWTARCLAVAVAYVTMVSTGDTHEDAVAHLLSGAKTAFDPNALRLFLSCVRSASKPENLREVRFEDLRPGMLLANDFTTPSGLVLFPRGQHLDEDAIARLHKHIPIHPKGTLLTVVG